MKIPPSSSKTICFARRRAPVTTRPRTSSTVGDTVRSTKGLARRMSRSISPVTRRSRWSTYTVRSGSSGIRWRRSGVLVRPAYTASRTCGAKYVIWRRVHLSTLPRETSAPGPGSSAATGHRRNPSPTSHSPRPAPRRSNLPAILESGVTSSIRANRILLWEPKEFGIGRRRRTSLPSSPGQ